MFTIASQIAENFGYDNIHHMEYDCMLKNKNLINEHNSLYILKFIITLFINSFNNRLNNN